MPETNKGSRPGHDPFGAVVAPMSFPPRRGGKERLVVRGQDSEAERHTENGAREGQKGTN